MSEPQEPIYHFCGTEENVLFAIAAWQKRRLAWAIQGDLPGVPGEAFRGAIAESFASWQSVCGLQFYEATGPVDIVLTTGPIDRAGGVLAWSELPDGSERQLTQRYDTRDRFVVATRPGPGQIDLVAVGSHEIGHALGLEHAPNGSPDLMAPIYEPGRRFPQPGDIERIQRLYGKPVPADVPPSGPAGPIVIRIWGAERVAVDGYRVIKE